jgi:HEAT repeat protein
MQFSPFTWDGHSFFARLPAADKIEPTGLVREGCIFVGLFDFIKNLGGNKETRIARSSDLAKNPKAIREDRWAAIEFLADDVADTKSAVRGLLARFEFSLEHGINDTREKEKALSGIMRHGDAALPIILEHLKITTRIAWPIKILKSLVRSEERVVECLLSTLDYSDVAFDQARTDKNYDILCHLADYKRHGLKDRISPFLSVPDERVRYAAAEVLMEQDLDEVGETLEKLMRDENPDNSRIRQAVVQKYLDLNWAIQKPDAFANRQVIGPVYINDQNRLVVSQS